LLGSSDLALVGAGDADSVSAGGDWKRGKPKKVVAMRDQNGARERNIRETPRGQGGGHMIERKKHGPTP